MTIIQHRPSAWYQLLLHILQVAAGYRLKVVANMCCSLASSCRWCEEKTYASQGNLEQTIICIPDAQTLNWGSPFVKEPDFHFLNAGKTLNRETLNRD
jgi:hypothetical protein